MKVLLLGEFSGLHTELAKGLRVCGVDVFTISDGDGFKNYPADIVEKKKNTRSNLVVKVFRFIVSRFAFKIGLGGLFMFLRHWSKLRYHMTGYDIVEINNPTFLRCYGNLILLYISRYVRMHNKHVFLSAMGNDYYVDKFLSTFYKTRLAFLTEKKIHGKEWKRIPHNPWFYKKLNDYLVDVSDAIIPIGYFYQKSYQWSGKVASVIPTPIDPCRIGTPFNIKEGDIVNIFHGWQKGRLIKGNEVFDRVINRVVDKYGSEKVNYQVVSNVPFNEYIKLFRNAHIFIDQLYADDKGMNGLFGMAAGKVVFSGFMPESLELFSDYHGERIGIPASTDEEELFNQFCDLIEHPLQMNEISHNAVEFVKKNHDFRIVAKMYLEEWARHYRN